MFVSIGTYHQSKTLSSGRQAMITLIMAIGHLLVLVMLNAKEIHILQSM